jgi:hypothetical protein
MTDATASGAARGFLAPVKCQLAAQGGLQTALRKLRTQENREAGSVLICSLICVVAGCANIELPIWAGSRPIEITKGGAMGLAYCPVSEAHFHDQGTFPADDISAEPAFLNIKIEAIRLALAWVNDIGTRSNLNAITNVIRFNYGIECIVGKSLPVHWTDAVNGTNIERRFLSDVPVLNLESKSFPSDKIIEQDNINRGDPSSRFGNSHSMGINAAVFHLMQLPLNAAPSKSAGDCEKECEDHQPRCEARNWISLPKPQNRLWPAFLLFAFTLGLPSFVLLLWGLIHSSIRMQNIGFVGCTLATAIALLTESIVTLSEIL